MKQDDGMAATVNRAAEAGRAPFYDKAKTQHLAPLWRVLGGLVPAEPVTPCVPAIWHYKEIRPYLMEACELIRAEEAERRVLTLENPALPGESRITRSLFAGLQIILPGETAPAHRHMAAALRFIVEGKNAFTAVGGEKTVMEPGDFVITPSMAWHDHGNESDAPMVWLDGLDLHMVNMFDASFRDAYPQPRHPTTRPNGTSNYEWGMNMLPVDHEYRDMSSPIFNYPYNRTRETLDALARSRAVDPWHGYKMRYINPLTGDWAMPTISVWMQLLPKGFKTAPYRATDATVFAVVEGTGSSTIGTERFDWGPKDVFVAPSWMFQEHAASSDAVIFSFSDRVAQEKLGYFREQKGNQ
jgi:gentisate 1,2-dioxygenase